MGTHYLGYLVDLGCPSDLRLDLRPALRRLSDAADRDPRARAACQNLRRLLDLRLRGCPDRLVFHSMVEDPASPTHGSAGRHDEHYPSKLAGAGPSRGRHGRGPDAAGAEAPGAGGAESKGAGTW